MSLIICSRCDKRRDMDFHECVHDPKTDFDLMCWEHEEEDAEDEAANLVRADND
jgi:hypothetical protein